MGNLTYLIPTRAADACTAKDLHAMLRTRFAHCTFALDAAFEQVRVSRPSDDELVCMLYISPCTLLDPQELQAGWETAQTDDEPLVASRYRAILALNLPQEPAVSISYALDRSLSKTREDIVAHLKTIFEAYLFDEGIHPEFVAK